MMADGFELHLDQARAERLKSAADASGISLKDFALRALDRAVEDDLAEDLRRLEEYDRTGEFLTAEDWMAGLRNAVTGHRTR